MTTVYVGIDIHKEHHVVAIIPISKFVDNTWTKVKPFSVSNNRADYDKIIAHITEIESDPASVQIALDHTGGYYSAAIVHYLAAQKYPLFYIESKGLKHFKLVFMDKEDKTDLIDSMSMARALYARDVLKQDLRISTIEPQQDSLIAVIRIMLTLRWQLQTAITQITNRLHQTMIATFPEGESKYFEKLCEIAVKYPMPHDILSDNQLRDFPFRKSTKQAIISLAKETAGISIDHYGVLIRELAMQRQDLIAKQERITNLLIYMCSDEPAIKILKSFPHIKDVTAITLFSVIGDIHRWRTIAQFRKALGVYPLTEQSGKNLNNHHMGREGSKVSRRALFQIVFGLISPRAHDNYIRDYYGKKLKQGMPKMKAIIACMGKLCRLLYNCLNAGVMYEYKAREVAASIDRPSAK